MCNCVNKLVLFIVNVIFFLAGAAIVAVSIWVIASKNTLFNLVHVATAGSSVNTDALANYQNATSTLMAAAYVVLAFGILSLVIGFCGCCGAIRESSCLLMIYAGAISVILLVEIAGGIAAGVFKAQLAEKMKPTLTDLQAKRFVPLNELVNNPSNGNGVITAYVNYAQVLLQCCGVTAISDITKTGTLWSNSSRIFPTGSNMTLRVPVTCCSMNSSAVGQFLAIQAWNQTLSYLQDPTCPYVNNSSSLIGDGCLDKIDSYISRYTVSIIIVGIVVGLFEIICVVMACSMIQKIRSEGKNV